MTQANYKSVLEDFLAPLFQYPSIKWELLPNDGIDTFELIIHSDLLPFEKKVHHFLKVKDDREIWLLKGEEFRETDEGDFLMALFLEEFFREYPGN